MRTTPPFRADHVGSLLRPASVLAARDEFASGQLDAAQLRAVEDAAIAEVVNMQAQVGLQSATDGEFRRASWHMDFIYQLGGISKAPGNLAVKFRNQSGTIEFTPAALHVGSKIRLDRTIFEDDFTYLQSVATSATPKLTIPSPNMVHYRGGPAAIDPEIYPDMEEFWSDLSAAYAEQVRRLGALGCRYLQLDDTSLAYLNDPAQRAEIADRGEDAEHLHLRYIRQVNDAISDRPDGMAVTTHMCRGNFRSSWAAEGGYDFVAEALFSELDVDGFFLEYDDERSGGFEPLRFVPKGKMVVLGLVTTKSGKLENPDDLKRRIDEAGQVRPARSALPVTAVRVLLNGRGERADRGRAGRQAPPDRPGRQRRVGLGHAVHARLARLASRKVHNQHVVAHAPWQGRDVREDPELVPDVERRHGGKAELIGRTGPGTHRDGHEDLLPVAERDVVQHVFRRWRYGCVVSPGQAVRTESGPPAEARRSWASSRS